MQPSSSNGSRVMSNIGAPGMATAVANVVVGSIDMIAHREHGIQTKRADRTPTRDGRNINITAARDAAGYNSNLSTNKKKRKIKPRGDENVDGV